jgi:DNA-directed RNA polymerase sigma subunit (sigma70/sigma32)
MTRLVADQMASRQRTEPGAGADRNRGTRQQAERAARALILLDEHERRIFEARHLADEPVTLEDLPEELGVSRGRVRQIEVRSFEKVRNSVQRRVAAMQGSQAPSLPSCGAKPQRTPRSTTHLRAPLSQV